MRQQCARPMLEGVNGSPETTPQARDESLGWLVLVPTICAIGSLFLMGAAPGCGSLVAGALLPAFALVAAVARGRGGSRLPTLWPLIPFGVGTVGLAAATMVVVAAPTNVDPLETGGWYGAAWAVLVYSTLALPFAAACGGMAAMFQVRN
jgi:hypothetical protein